MKKLRLAMALTVAVLGAASMAEAGKPAWAPPNDSAPDTLLAYACSLLPDGVASWIPFCEE